MTRSLYDLFSLSDSYISYLKARGVGFDRRGFPRLASNQFLNSFPDTVVTYKERKSSLVHDPSQTVLCFYCPDDRIYPRLDKVFNELDEYRKFKGVIATDVTVTADMDLEWQRATMLVNQLFMAVLAVNDIKVVLNLRSGVPETLDCFSSIPRGIVAASGLLGCAMTTRMEDLTYATKLLTVMPSKVLLYGKRDSLMEQQIACSGIPFRRYPDVHAQYSSARHPSHCRTSAAGGVTPRVRTVRLTGSR